MKIKSMPVYIERIYDVYCGVMGGLLISAVMLTGGTSKYGPPPPLGDAAVPWWPPEYAFRVGRMPAVTKISGLALGVSVQSRTPTVT